MNEPIALVVGYGSIGERHVRVLSQLGQRVAVVSRRPLDLPHAYQDLAVALAAEQPGYVVIATETAQHRDDLSRLAQLGFTGRVLVEKPLFAEPADLPEHRFASLHVGYNLRFHPLLRRVKEMLQASAPLSADFYVGQYLPSWRPGRDYRTSASAARGSGGVIRDLSHELDYITWLLGPWRRLTAIGGRFSMLEIDSDDTFGLLIQTEHCPLVTIQMNYLDRIGCRRLVINGSDLTLHGDLVAGVLQTGSGRETFSLDRDSTYRDMHRAVMNGSDPDLCDAAAGTAVVDMISAAERAASGVWFQQS